MFRFISCALFAALFLFSKGQSGPRSWQDHLSINTSNSVTKLGNKIYASNYNGIVYFDEQELAPQKLTKINGLSDVGIRLLRTNPYNNRLVVVYENANIDVLDLSGKISNYPDMKLKTMNARKTINDVFFRDQMAWLACGFGIVQFDTERLEIKETFYIGPGGDNLEVYQVALNDSLIFAATESGMMTCNYKRTIPNNFRNWFLDTTSIPAGPYNGVLNVEGKIICNYSAFLKNQEQERDTFYMYTGGGWIKYPPLATSGGTTLRMGPVQGDLFAVLNMHGPIVRNIHTGDLINYVPSFNGEIDYGTVRDNYFSRDFSGNFSYWVSDSRFGLYQTYSYYPFYPQNKVLVNGLNRANAAKIDLLGGRVAVAPSKIDNTGTAPYMREGINVLRNQEWKYIPVLSPDGKPAADITSVIFDRRDPTRLFASAFEEGIYEYKDDQLVRRYTSADPGLPRHDLGATRSQGLFQDADGNIWFANSEVREFLSVIRTNGDYRSFQFDAARFTRKVFVDRNKYVWILHEREGGITIFRHNNFSTPVQGVNYKLLNTEAGKGGLQSNSVYAIAEDKDGRIWIGTQKGISVFYNPSAIFSSNTNFDSQPIKIVQDGNVELLLGNETVTSIVVDGANNKWVGTENGGLYCFSPDGIREIYHFTKDNSPLYSNTILDLAYDEITGDVFIGSGAGLQTFRSTIVKGSESYNEIHAFPNPVKPGYSGTVLVRGLIDNSIIKVTDSRGHLVWEGKTTGGQAEWPVTNLSGARAETGVYLIYASLPDGTVSAVTKVLVMN